MKADQERVRNLLTDTVTLLCKNGLQYQTELRVQGVLGITLDNNDVFIVHINEKFGDAIGGALTIRNDEGDAAKTLLGSTRLNARKSSDAIRGETPVAVNSKTREAVHRQRRRSRESSASPALPINSSQQQILQRPIKRLLPSNKEASPSGVRNVLTLQNSMGGHPAVPGSDDIIDVKVKTEEDDVILVEQSQNDNAEISGTAPQDIPHTTDHNAMQESYPNLSLSELQGSYQPFGEILGVTDSSTNSGADGTAPPATKRRATSGNTQDSFGGSSELGPTPDAGGPFITGIIRNETMTGEVAPQTTTATTWDPSQMPDFGTLTSRDSQMILDSTPGCSTWDTSQQSQASAATTATTTHIVQNISDQFSESRSQLTASSPVDGHRHDPDGTTLSSAAIHQDYISWSSDLMRPMRRSVAGMNKQFRCTYGSCDKAFYDRKNLLRHQTLKHDRKPDRATPRPRIKILDTSYAHDIHQYNEEQI